MGQLPGFGVNRETFTRLSKQSFIHLFCKFSPSSSVQGPVADSQTIGLHMPYAALYSSSEQRRHLPGPCIPCQGSKQVCKTLFTMTWVRAKPRRKSFHGATFPKIVPSNKVSREENTKLSRPNQSGRTGWKSGPSVSLQLTVSHPLSPIWPW